jgi:hypothetical protein
MINPEKMKRHFAVLVIVVFGMLRPAEADAQGYIIDIIKAAIMAIDVGIQKVQTQTIYLQEAQKEVENAMAQLHLTDITNWVQKQKDLYSEYYQELWDIKNAIAEYQRVKDIINKQIALVQNYKNAYAQVTKDPHFSPDELAHILKVYDGILAQSVENIGQITNIIKAFVTQMDDADRLRIINEAANRVDRNYSDLNNYSQQNILLSTQRSKDQEDLEVIRSLYGIK